MHFHQPNDFSGTRFYWAIEGIAIVFVDHFSRLRYIHLQKNDTSFKTLEAKKAIKAYCSLYCHTEHHYHCNNGQLEDNAFLLDVSTKNQSISFCDLIAHFQNEIAEMAICNIQDQARKLILHAHARWPQAIHILLWPYVLGTACHVSNILSVNLEGK